MAFADGDLVDGDLLELVRLGLAEAALQGAGLDVLDRVPADVPLEGAGVVLLGVGEAELDRPDLAAVKATHPGDREVQEHRLGADGRQAERSRGCSMGKITRPSRNS